MKLQQLKYFVEICNEKSINRAAQKLFLSQPTLSVAIRELEKEFGCKLLVRDSQGIRLTEAGEYLYVESLGLLRQAQALQTAMHQFQVTSPAIRLGIPTMASAYILPNLLSAYNCRCTSRSLQIFEGGSLSLLEQLRRGELDFAIVTDISDDACDSVTLYQSETLFYISAQSPLAAKKQITFSDLDQVPLVLFEQSSYALNQKIKQRFLEAGVRMNIFCQTSQVLNMYQLISSGQAGGFISRQLQLQIPNAVSIPFYPAFLAPVRLLWKRDSRLQGDSQLLHDICMHFSQYVAKPDETE